MPDHFRDPAEIFRTATIAELGRALRAGEVTAGQLAERALAVADTVGRRYGAVASLTAARGTAEAAAADIRLADGDPAPLLGIPYGAKDVIAAAGAPTAWGVVSLRHRVIDADATVIERLSRSGAALVAKVVTAPLAGGGGLDVPGISMYGQVRNPWDPGRFAGGSSSGSAIAVAIGAVPFALGSETGGSVMQPAAYCGVTGYRPTWGLMPRSGMMELSWRLDKVGVLARSAADCATVLAVLAGPDGTDTSCSGDIGSPATPSDVSSIRLGISADDLDGTDPVLRSAARRGFAEITELVGAVVAAELPRDRGYGPAIEALVQADACTALAALIADPSTVLPDPSQLGRLRAGAPPERLEPALEVREHAIADFAKLFAEVDVVCTVAMGDPPQRLSEPKRPRGSSTASDRLLAAANLAGIPGVTVPCGLDDEGLPVALHLVGPRGSDGLLFALAQRYQSVTDHHRRLPPGSLTG